MEENSSQPSQPVPVVQATPQEQSAPIKPPKPGSSKPLIIVLGVVVLFMIIGLVFYLITVNNNNKISESKNILTDISPTVTKAITQSNNGAPSLSSVDIELQQDMQDIDTSLGKTTTELQNVDDGLNDQSVNLTE